MCKLADVSHRINRCTDHDIEQISNWIEKELLRQKMHEKSFVSSQNRLIILKGTDKSNVMEECFEILSSEMDNLTGKLNQALVEEEEARKVKILFDC